MTVAEIEERIMRAWFHTSCNAPGQAPELCRFTDGNGDSVTVAGQLFQGNFTATITGPAGQTRLGPYSTASDAVAGIAAALGAS